MSKTQENYLGKDSYIDQEFIHLNITNLLVLSNTDFWNRPAPEDFNAHIALIISALFNGSLTEKDEYNYTVVDKTQGIVSDEDSFKSRVITREDEKQVLHEFVFHIYSKYKKNFNPLQVINSTTTLTLLYR